MALNPEDTPRQNKELFSWSFANGNIPHSLKKVTHFIFLYHSSSSQHCCSLGPLTSQYLENGATHTLFSRCSLGTSLLHACAGCQLCPWLLPLTLCHTSSKDAEHFLFRRVLIKLECGNEDTPPPFPVSLKLIHRSKNTNTSKGHSSQPFSKTQIPPWPLPKHLQIENSTIWGEYIHACFSRIPAFFLSYNLSKNKQRIHPSTINNYW